MKLKEFVEKFVYHNAIVNLKCDDGFITETLFGKERPLESMAHAVSGGYSKFNNYADREVVHVLGGSGDSVFIKIIGNIDQELVSSKECERLLNLHRFGTENPNVGEHIKNNNYEI